MMDRNLTLEELFDVVVKGFSEYYGRKPRWVVAAPGRVNIIGEHTDYNDGFVLPMAIEKYTVIAADNASPNVANQINWACGVTKKSAVIKIEKPIGKGEKGDWTNYIRGVLNGFLELNAKIPSLDVYMYSTVPIGGGVSSSAALEVATATLMEIVTGRKLDKVDKALLSQKAEHTYAGMPCGIMDQFISALGEKDHLLLIDCRDKSYKLVKMADPEVSVLVFNTNVKHKLVGGEYAERRSQCEKAAQVLGVKALRDATIELLNKNKSRLETVVYNRAKHVIEENERTVQATKLIENSDWTKVGELLYASHYSLKDMFEVSCRELDIVVELAKKIGIAGGIYGCRMTGGGFGGCAIALVKSNLVNQITAKLIEGYKKQTGIQPSVFVSRPSQGATVLK
ncbi:MAG: galactokinase [Verrucomicrobiae bacterium]|nr:galactokinase [Verrucomicrobiae bacterium]